MRKIGGCHQFRVIQRALDQVVVRLVPDRTWSGEHPGRIRDMVHEFFGSPVRVEVETVSRLELSAGGKSADVVSELDTPTIAQGQHETQAN